jgi:hypothetical protein
LLAVNVPALDVLSAKELCVGPAIPERLSVAVQVAVAALPTVTDAGQVSDPVGGDLSIEIAPDDAVVVWPTRSVRSPERWR